MLPSYAPMRNTYLQQLLLLWFCHEHKLVVKTCAASVCSFSLPWFVTGNWRIRLINSSGPRRRSSSHRRISVAIFGHSQHSFVALSSIWLDDDVDDKIIPEPYDIIWVNIVERFQQTFEGFHCEKYGLTMTMQLCLKQRLINLETKVNRDQSCKPFL